MSTDIKVGDTVERIEYNNGTIGAKVGQRGVVKGINKDGFLIVHYKNCWRQHGHYELWCTAYAERVP